jgi:hypothetical protein
MCLQTRCTLVVVAAFLLNLLHKIGTSAISEVLVQVPVGETVTLMCQSNDENHNFFYWYLNEKNIIVGPSNTYDIGKFKYEVLSGNLTIKVSSRWERSLWDFVLCSNKKHNVYVTLLSNNKFIIAFIFNTIVPSKEVIWYGSQAVSKNEEGVYNCVSRGVADDDVNIRSVRMVVQGDWEEVYETDPYVSFWQESRFSQRSAKTSCLAR